MSSRTVNEEIKDKIPDCDELGAAVQEFLIDMFKVCSLHKNVAKTFVFARGANVPIDPTTLKKKLKKVTGGQPREFVLDLSLANTCCAWMYDEVNDADICVAECS